MTKYRKTIVALVGAGIVILTRAFGSNSTVVFDVVALATALGVYGVPNE